MKASTQLIDDSTGVGYIQPLSCDEPEIFNFVINEHTIHFFGNHWRFLDNRSGAAICALGGLKQKRADRGRPARW
jgi:hypothetical protein